MQNNKEIECKPLVKETWPDLEQLFGKSGAYWGCWCMYWRCTNKEFEKMNGSDRKLGLYKAVMENTHAPGMIAFIDNKPVGWIALSPREEYKRLVNSRVIKPFDDKKVWSIVCFYIHTNNRGMGISRKLLESSEKYAKTQGVTILEAYPIESSDEKIKDLYAYVGTEKEFTRVGFKKITDTKAKSGGLKRIVMRKEL